MVRRHTVRRSRAHSRDQALFSEPQFTPALVATVTADTGVRAGVLDPLGAALPPGPDAWFGVLRGIADGLVACLAP